MKASFQLSLRSSTVLERLPLDSPSKLYFKGTTELANQQLIRSLRD
jgi:hypothetical protein